MRGRRFVSAAVRRANGEIVLHNEPISRGVYSSTWAKLPFLRAVTVLSDTLVLGTRMLVYSANIQAGDELATEKKGKGEDKGGASNYSPKGSSPVEQPLPPAAIYGTLAVSLGLGIAVFFALPVLVASFLDGFIHSPLANNVIEGVIRLALFLGYLILIGRVANVRRVFQYHGAEHKTIAAFEAGSELTPDLIQHYNKEHPRCGTGFLLTVVVVSILFFILLGDLPLPVRFASRILLIPIVAAVSYELIRFASQHRGNPLFDWLVVRPSLALQSLTTREPTNEMVEVAVAAFKDVRDKEIKAGDAAA